ncbi:DUF2249 domain-containing protein [Pontibacter ruber]|uniref:DUF2249 domain-containing protein n=1 Tax=Pontibacter ruber TaxID=1343895 RepID=A0ABW5CT96_9BACT|nr:DUF2249 domain-containing protein [Pontibacter ruber]
MELAATTRISAIIKENPAAIEAIVSINKHFEKLRNPLLRKILASRVTIADAARIGNCQVTDFYEKLAPLGFSTPANESNDKKSNAMNTVEKPAFMKRQIEANTVVLDVRQTIASGRDPFLEIMAAVDALKTGEVLCIVNTFEPTPLIAILQKKGFAYYTETLAPDLIHTYFSKEESMEEPDKAVAAKDESDFDALVQAYDGLMQQVDVRELEMPQPMVTILSALEKLPEAEALYVVHRRVPQFLIPQLQERGFSLCYKEKGPARVDLLIYKET